ncbi:uncharacterized protein LOC120944785 [Rana temporaria]|uniref:uncharacterized protein LOC120944785 n=1 Tax=Rana temporaria TaxID=8407 RepID=UPI001AAD8BA7|nr:uncharacterized protein LOC120944785 [Rana temporaria]
MFSGQKGKMKNVASFIKENVNIVENSILGIVLLGLEKLMDLEFTCPADEGLGIGYSLVFLIVPTLIVGFVACYFIQEGLYGKARKKGNSAEIRGGTEEGDTAINVQSNLETSETKTETKNAKCGICCAKTFFVIKVVVAWILIVLTDGRYGDCFVRSVDERIKNPHYSALSAKEILNNYLTHLFQIIGLILILLAIILVCFCELKIKSILSSCGGKCRRKCKCECECECECESESESESELESEKSRRKNEENLLQITEDTLQEQARKRQEEFVVTLLCREDWASYDPGSPNALEELGKITAKWKEEVKRQLEGEKRTEAKETPALGRQMRKEPLLPPNHQGVTLHLKPLRQGDYRHK